MKNCNIYICEQQVKYNVRSKESAKDYETLFLPIRFIW